jgi:hypothetical protein
MIEFKCRRGKHTVDESEAKNFHYQYMVGKDKVVLARGVCNKDGANLVQFVAKEKVPSGAKIEKASPKKENVSKGLKRSKKSKKSNKSGGKQRKSRKSQPARKSRKSAKKA